MNDTYLWYQTLIKPSWSPPSWLFGPVWTILYTIIAITFGIVFFKAFSGKIPRIVALPFVLNLIFNAAFTPIQFGLKNNLLASLDISLVLITLIWSFVAIWPYARYVVFANIPYFLWGTFASVLQFTITYLNR
jgi:tryptophan-rich sensory protein